MISRDTLSEGPNFFSLSYFFSFKKMFCCSIVKVSTFKETRFPDQLVTVKVTSFQTWERR